MYKLRISSCSRSKPYSDVKRIWKHGEPDAFVGNISAREVVEERTLGNRDSLTVSLSEVELSSAATKNVVKVSGATVTDLASS
jgi:hypothetical protein